jgi:hemerythrin-like domain-containing protein
MCSYCGCEAEAVIAGLMADHADIADLVYRIGKALDSRLWPEATALTARLADVFERHSRAEEAGLFAQLQDAGEAREEVDQLFAEHRHLRAALGQPDAAADPHRLRLVLEELGRHAAVEDNDLFPFAMQQLPDDCWAALMSR